MSDKNTDTKQASEFLSENDPADRLQIAAIQRDAVQKDLSRHLNRAARHDPSSPAKRADARPDARHYYDRGRDFLEQNRKEDALACFQRAVDLDPENIYYTAALERTVVFIEAAAFKKPGILASVLAFGRR